MSSLTPSRVFQLVGGHPALDLVNTLDWRFRDGGGEDLLASYDDLLSFATQTEILKAKQVREIVRSATQAESADALVSCRAMREAAAEVFYAAVDGRHPQAHSIRLLDTMFREARTHQQLSWDELRMRWEWPEAPRDADLPVWMLTVSVARLMLSDDMHRLRACEKPDCRWLFLDTSKNHTRRWCDMKLCGNRMKARRFKAQHKS
jgi:predicted RNA-binding Zn ribbon-like protein